MHDHHHHYFNFFRNRKLNEIYINIAIRAFALSLSTIFIPIYLLNIGYTFGSVFLFYALTRAVHAAISIPAAKLASRYGFKHMIFYSIPFLIAFFALLFSIETYRWPLSLLAVVGGLNAGLFWIGFHVDFGKFSSRKRRGTELGRIIILSSVLAVAGPFLGGVTAMYLGFKILFFAIAGMLLLSTIPLFWSKDLHSPAKFTMAGVFKNQSMGNLLSFFGYGIDRALGLVVWPVFLFFNVLDSYGVLGSIFSVMLLFSLLLTLVISKLVDSYRRTILRIGSLMNAAVWVARTFVKTPIHVFITDALYGISHTAVYLPFNALAYDKANKKDLVKFTVFREIVLNLGQVAIFLTMYFFSDFIMEFIIGGVGGSLLMWFF